MNDEIRMHAIVCAIHVHIHGQLASKPYILSCAVHFLRALQAQLFPCPLLQCLCSCPRTPWHQRPLPFPRSSGLGSRVASALTWFCVVARNVIPNHSSAPKVVQEHARPETSRTMPHELNRGNPAPHHRVATGEPVREILVALTLGYRSFCHGIQHCGHKAERVRQRGGPGK